MRHHSHAILTLLVTLSFAPTATAAQHAGGPSIHLQKVAEGLVAPIQLTAPHDGTGRRFVVDQIGLVRILTRDGVDFRQRLSDALTGQARAAPAEGGASSG